MHSRSFFGLCDTHTHTSEQNPYHCFKGIIKRSINAVMFVSALAVHKANHPRHPKVMYGGLTGVDTRRFYITTGRR